MENGNTASSLAAEEAVRRGYQPIPVRTRSKRPMRPSWTHEVREATDDVAAEFTAYAAEGAANVGLLLGAPSGGLIDIDIDHPKASRLKAHFLPATPMRSGRAGRPDSHYWYRATGTLPGTRRYQMPDKSVSVELRSTGSQTVIPPSIHPSGEPYRWEGPSGEWAEPAEVDGRVLALQVALLALSCVLIENWPGQGSRHEAYLALTGGLLRFGNDVHPWWEKNVSVLIRALAMATGDEDGPDEREKESVRTTVAKLREGRKVVGWPRLAEIIGADHVRKARQLVAEVESLAGFKQDKPVIEVPDTEGGDDEEEGYSTAPPKQRDPMAERSNTWQPVDLNPLLTGEYQPPEPTVLTRNDGYGVLYPGRVNCLYGRSESAKSWIALIACIQEMAKGERVVYIDLEDEPTFTIYRLKQLGVGDDDIRYQFTYIRPEEPLAPMEVNRRGSREGTAQGHINNETFLGALEQVDPRLIVVDGMTVLYGTHGLDTNDAMATDVITSWLKSLVRNGRSTVVVIDHTSKGAPKGSTPLGSQHKVSMVQGTAIQVHPIDTPRPGAVGRVELLVGKDRPGQVRRFATDEEVPVAAEVILDSTIEGMVQYEIRPAPEGSVSVEGEPDDFEYAVKRTLHDVLYDAIPRVFDGDYGRELTAQEIREGLEERFEVTSGNASFHRAVKALREVGIVQKLGGTRDARYRLMDP